MVWTHAICGHIKSDYCHFRNVVYNNFPTLTPTTVQIEQTAQAILGARNLYPNHNLVDLCDETAHALRATQDLLTKPPCHYMQTYGSSMTKT